MTLLKSMKRVSSIKLTFMMVLVIIGSPLLAFCAILGYGQLEMNGLSVRWKSLGQPTETIQRITVVTLDQIYVETEAQHLFVADVNRCSASETCWKRLDAPVEVTSRFSAEEDCWGELIIARPPGKVIASKQATDCGSGGMRTARYVLQADGTVWVWSYESPDLFLLPWFFYALYGAAGGGFIGVFIASLLWAFNYKGE